MKYGQHEVSIAPWISCRTYLFGKEESRTYISNERNHTCIMLESLGSDMWKLIYDDVPNDVFVQWADINGVTESINDFLEELAEQDLIILNNSVLDDSEQGNYSFDDTQGDEERTFVQEMQAWLFENKFMYSIFFELTYRCNLKCVHCYNPKDMSSVEIDFEQCKKAIDDAYALGCFKVTFSGGEATLHSRFYELVEYARNKKMSVEIFTNGQTFAKDSKLYNKILKLYPYRICVSLYSTDKEIHEKVTAVPDSFEKTYELIERMRADNVNVQIKNFLLNFNCMDCIQVRKHAIKVGASSVADISLIPTIEGDKKTFQYMLDDEALFRLYTNPESPLYLGADYVPWADYEERKQDFPCFGGYTVLCVNPTGKVTICVSMPYTVGDLKKESLYDIWQKAVKKDPDSRLYKWRQITIADFSECYNEEYCKFCEFCPGMGYLENGYLKKSNVRCAQAKVKMRAYNFLKNKT